MFLVDFVEALEVQRLAPEQLHGRHPGDVLLQKGVDAGDPCADDAVRFADVAPEPLRNERDEREHREGDERQTPVHRQHDDHDSGQCEHVAENRHDARREQIVQDVDVGGHPRHQTADRIAIVVCEVEPLKVAVDRHPQVEHDPLTGHLHRPGLEVFRGKRTDENDEVERGEPIEASEPAGGDKAIDRGLDEVRLGELGGGAGDDGDECNGHLPPVRPQVRQQAPHQPRVVRLAEDFFFVEGSHRVPSADSPRRTQRTQSKIRI